MNFLTSTVTYIQINNLNLSCKNLVIKTILGNIISMRTFQQRKNAILNNSKS